MPFFQDMDRASATQWILANPLHPVLRPCTYTRTYPQILVVTYRVNTHVLHSLVEQDGDAFYSVIWATRGQWTRETRYPSAQVLEQTLLLLLDPGDEADEDPAPYEVSEDPVPA